LVTARHQNGSMILTSNRDPSEWLGILADPLLAQALVDRFTNNAYDLVIEGESYRKNQKPRLKSD
jgi:DNA replication protein DnaC